MNESSRKPNEGLMSYARRITLSKRDTGMTHKEWGNALLGKDNNYSSENCRKGFYILEKFFKNVNDEELNELENNKSEDNMLEEIKDIIGELNIKKQEIKSKTNQLNKIKRNFIKSIEISNDLKETIREEMENFPQLNYKPMISKTENRLIVVLSDWHIGYVIRGYKGNSYDYNIAIKRLNMLYLEVLKTCSLYNINEVTIVNCGDTIENMYMRQNQSYECEFDLSSQIVKATQLLYSFVTKVSEIANVDFYSIGGNHSRMAGMKDANTEGDNANVIITEMLRNFVQLSSNERITIHNTDYKDDSCVFEVNGFKCKAIHGDNRVSDPKKLFDAEATMDKEDYQIILRGHYHNFDVSSQNDGYVITTGSLFGFNPYSVKRMSCTTSASQTMIVISDKIECIKDVNLQII